MSTFSKPLASDFDLDQFTKQVKYSDDSDLGLLISVVVAAQTELNRDYAKGFVRICRPDAEERRCS